MNLINGKSDCLAAQAAKVDFPEPASPSIKTVCSVVPFEFLTFYID